MNREALRSLAAKVEAAPSDNAELFGEVFRALFPKPARIWVTDNNGPWTEEYSAWQEKQSRFYELLEAEAYESAAMRLVPEGVDWEVGYAKSHGEYLDERLNGANGFAAVAGRNVFATSPALALTAACLRALAEAAQPHSPRGENTINDR